jgi:hypothetical protein
MDEEILALTQSEGHYSLSDKLAMALVCLTAILAIVLFLVEKTPKTILGLLVAILVFGIYPILHFFKNRWLRIGALIVLFAATFVFGYPMWKRSKAEELNKEQGHSSPAATQKTQGDNYAKVSTPDKKTSHRITPQPQSISGRIHGSKNTIVGRSQFGTIDGNENTIVGAPDSNGNTMLNQGGTTIGAGACGCPTCVVVGANAGCAQPTPRLKDENIFPKKPDATKPQQ